MRVNKMEEMAKVWEDKVPNLAKALRSEDLQKSIADMEMFDGWIRCGTSLPQKEEQVLVTNGIDVWMGEISITERVRGVPFKEWSVVYDGAPPFTSNDVIAWTYKPTVLPNLFDRDKVKFICAIDSDSFNYIPKKVLQIDIELSEEDITGYDTETECQIECDKLNSL